MYVSIMCYLWCNKTFKHLSLSCWVLVSCVRIYKMLKCCVYKFIQLTMTYRTYHTVCPTPTGTYHLCRINIGTIRIVCVRPHRNERKVFYCLSCCLLALACRGYLLFGAIKFLYQFMHLCVFVASCTDVCMHVFALQLHMCICTYSYLCIFLYSFA